MTQVMTITIISLWDASMHKYSAVANETIDQKKILEEVFARQQDDHKDIPDIPSMCSGDMVGINGALYLCTSTGWKKMDYSILKTWLDSSPSKRMLLATMIK